MLIPADSLGSDSDEAACPALHEPSPGYDHSAHDLAQTVPLILNENFTNAGVELSTITLFLLLSALQCPMCKKAL